MLVIIMFFLIFQILSDWGFRISSIKDLPNYIEVGFATHKWKIYFHDSDGELVFDDGWIKFCTVCNINIGDICCFNRTKVVNSFEIAIYHMNGILQCNPPNGKLWTQKILYLTFKLIF